MSAARPARALPLALCVLLAAATASAQPPADATAATPDGVFAAWDGNADGALSPAEFGAGWARLSQAAVRRNLQARFASHDRDRNGALDGVEVAGLELVRQAGATGPVLARFDRDRSGALEFPEYLALVAALAQEPTGAKR